jgi:hypothetical protein
VSEPDITWTTLASRVMRAALARKGTSYAALAAELGKHGIEETARSVEGKIQRGGFKFAFFLQSLSVIGAETPSQWRAIINEHGSWEQRAQRIIVAEMYIRPNVSFVELSRRLKNIGVGISSRFLAEQVQSGAYPFTLLLQCAAVLCVEGLERFIDASDLRTAAAASDELSIERDIQGRESRT